MDWRDQGLLLALRPHGESAAIIETFTPGHGRHAGVVRGAAARRMASVLQPGNQLDLHWQARLEDHLGHFGAELVQTRSHLWDDRLTLAGLNAVCGLLHFALPERDPHPGLYLATVALLDEMAAGAGWPGAYLRWELLLLDELGYGLDLSACAVTGATEDLAFVSPKSGRSVSRAAGADWADRLLPLPACLRGEPPASAADLAAALATTGFFLQQRLAADLAPKVFPAARQRLTDLLKRPDTLPFAP
ncbi:MAG: DNA repair protein RecO [Proteobacteria bacterium]|nr:DNA repair protein RecO [Pseudomonadota bacterium]MBS0574564.1 DNA repair protein RecO [Pseudomonadota bacterium]